MRALGLQPFVAGFSLDFCVGEDGCSVMGLLQSASFHLTDAFTKEQILCTHVYGTGVETSGVYSPRTPYELQ